MTTTPESERSSIRCPHCGQMVQLDEAIIHQLAAPLRAGWQEEIRQQIGDEVRATHARDLKDERAKRGELEDTLKERDQQIKELRDEEAKLRRERRKLEDEKSDLERAKERMRDEIRKQERADADARSKQRVEDELRQKESDFKEQLRLRDEDHEVKKRQLEDQLKRVKAQLDEAQRKTDSGVRQQEGIARQDLFGEELRRRFPDDLITVAGVGKRGPERHPGRACRESELRSDLVGVQADGGVENRVGQQAWRRGSRRERQVRRHRVRDTAHGHRRLQPHRRTSGPATSVTPGTWPSACVRRSSPSTGTNQPTQPGPESPGRFTTTSPLAASRRGTRRWSMRSTGSPPS